MSINFSTKIDKSHSERLQDYLDCYSVKIEMNGIYSHNAMTLKQNVSKMVLTMHSITAKGNHVSYNAFTNSQDCVHDENLKMLKEGPHFNFVERSSAEAVFVSKRRRFFGDDYDAFPTFSPDQTLVCMKRKMKYPSLMIDIYRCDSEEFFTEESDITRDIGEY